MKPDKISIFDLFYNQRQFAVPLYQRPYVWTLEAQWQPLWQDIEDKARAFLHRQTDVPHFLGAIVTGQRQVFGNQVPSWDIIDGQQRLTTLQVVLKSFSDLMQALGRQKYALDLERITRNDGLKETPDEQFKVWPTNSDRGTFRDVMTAGGVDKLVEAFPGLRGRRRRFVPRLAEVYVYFYRAMERFVSGADEDEVVNGEARTDALFQTFRRSLQVVNIELETGDDPQVIFESLNGRGVALLPSDLVRNLVFMRVGTANAANADGLYESYWRQYDEARFGASADEGPWWKQEERQGRLTRPRLDLFLFHYVQYRLQQEVHIGHLFQEFRKWWERAGAVNPAQALAEMQRHADAFRKWLEPDGGERTDDFARWLTALDTATVYPLLFLLLVEDESSLSQVEREGMVSDLESYLVRRAVCGLTNKHYNRYFPALLRKLQGGTVSRAALRAELASSKGDSTRWPGDDEFGRAFIHRPAYQVIRRPIVARLLDSLERALVNQFNNEVEVKGRLSIEHVMPQEWQSHWPLDGAGVGDSAFERRNLALQTLGNLTLVTPEFNSKLSNREFKVKRRELKRTSLLRLNQGFWDEGLEWDEGAIRQRGRELLDVARYRWPHPDSPPTLDALPLDSPPDGSWRIPDDEDVIDEPAIDPSVAISLLDEFARVRQSVAAGAATEVMSHER